MLIDRSFSTACFGGMLFGWDIGAIGGVLTLPPFMTYVLGTLWNQNGKN